MATYKSTQCTNNQTLPRVANNMGGDVKIVESLTTIGTAVDTADLLQLLELNWNDKIKSLKVFNTDLGTACPVKVGIAHGNGSSSAVGTVVDDDYFATALALGTASTTGTEIRFNTAALTESSKTVWEMAGLSAAPSGTAIILATVGTVDTGTTGTVLVQAVLV
jgi:hypothetical protein